MGAGRGRFDATVDVREAPIEGREGAADESCFVGDFVGDYSYHEPVN